MDSSLKTCPGTDVNWWHMETSTVFFRSKSVQILKYNLPELDSEHGSWQSRTRMHASVFRVNSFFQLTCLIRIRVSEDSDLFNRVASC